jgi:lathosterol oxidase
VKLEIQYTLWSVPWISIPTVALFFLEVRGYSKLYDQIEQSPLGKTNFQCKYVYNKSSKRSNFIIHSGWMKELANFVFFVLFTDMLIYWIHRFLHHRTIYKANFHKICLI